VKICKEIPGSRENRFSLQRQNYSNSTPEAMLCSEISVFNIYIYIFTYIKCREYIGALHKLYAMMI
jgi:hypothetical protein